MRGLSQTTSIIETYGKKKKKSVLGPIFLAILMVVGAGILIMLGGGDLLSALVSAR